MTTINRKRNLAPIVLGLFLIFSSTQALGEEDAVNAQTAQQQQANASSQQAYDQEYKLPPKYEGKYYPRADESAIGYHGTSNSAQNDPGHNGSYYYYYY